MKRLKLAAELDDSNADDFSCSNQFVSIDDGNRKNWKTIFFRWKIVIASWELYVISDIDHFGINKEMFFVFSFHREMFLSSESFN